MYLFMLQLLSLLSANVGIRRSYYLLEIDDSNYERVLKKVDLALVVFYRKPCEKCERILPEMSDAAENLADNNPPITVATVNCSGASYETCIERDVKYEYFFVVRHGKLYQMLADDYNATQLTSFMKTQLGPSFKKLKTFQQIETYLKNGTTAVVAGFLPKGSKRKSVFKNLAHKLRDDYRFTLTESLKKEEILLFHSYQMRNKLENNTVVYEGVLNEQTLRPWLWGNCDGVVRLRREGDWERYRHPLVMVYLDFDFDKNFQWFKYIHTRMVKVALLYKGFLNIAISSRKHFAIEIEGFPPNAVSVVGSETSGSHYLMEENFSFETLRKFIRAFLRQDLIPYHPSEPLPKRNDGLIKDVVKLNFKDLVLNNGKDTLILFYVNGCGGCIELMPVFEKLAAELMLENLSIVRTDVGKNALPAAYQVEQIPTVGLALKKSKDKKPLIYEGQRKDLNHLIKFVAKHTTAQLKKFDRKGNVRRIRNEL